ncbi:hypothetical protein HKL94_00245 [Candidatus Parcubacteria bacterium]|nr:hypothetical protein [Candidatus Parcubacteria bacterium]
MKNTLTGALVVLLIISVIAPAAFLAAPQRAHAQAFTGCIGGLAGMAIGGGGSAVSSVASVPVNSAVGDVINGGTEGSTVASCINAFIITPLIRAAIRALIQKMTASVINWINGSNGTGQPSYVQDLQGHLQLVGDIQANAFLSQFGVNSISPFASAITSALSTSYLQATSLAGFFAANQDTLTEASPNVNAFLAGDFSQGGVGAWFALTTESQNNPYMLYQSSQSELASMINDAQSARSAELSWGKGFLSWCGAASTPTQTTQSAPTQSSSDGLSQVTVTAQLMNPVGTAPGDTCRNANGTYGQIQTPGSVIQEYTQEAVVKSGFDQLISANDLDSALNAIIGALLNQVLGGVNGLFGASQTTATYPSLTSQLQSYSAGAASGSASGSSFVNAILQTALSQVATYQSAWQTISAAANAASTAVTSLMNSCTASAASGASASAAAAQTALTTEINPVLTQASAANTTASAMQAMIQKIQNELNSGISYTTDLQTLQTMPPTVTDVTNAVQDAQATAAGATAAPAGSLMVSGGSTVDQMNLIGTNAAALQVSACP